MEKVSNAMQISNSQYMIIYLCVILGTVGQQICLPLFIGSFNGLVGGYFVIFFCSVLFNLFFWPITFYRLKKGEISKEMKEYCYRKHWKFLLIGIFDALNGILIVYASALNRTPGPLQAVLQSAIIPFTVLFSKFFLTKIYTIQQLCGVVITILGIVVSLIPVMNDFGDGASSFVWPLIFLIGNIPAVLMNIYEEDIFEEFSLFDNIFLLAWESLYQVITVGFLFWTDIIPGFGTSQSFSNFSDRFSSGLSCFFTPWAMEEPKCNFSALIGLLFTMFYCFSYIFGASLMKYASANTTAIVSSVSPVIVIMFWIMFKSLNEWAGGEVYTKLQIICYLVSLPISIIGIVIYRTSEKKEMKDKYHRHKLLSDNINKETHETNASFI